MLKKSKIRYKSGLVSLGNSGKMGVSGKDAPSIYIGALTDFFEKKPLVDSHTPNENVDEHSAIYFIPYVHNPNISGFTTVEEESNKFWNEHYKPKYGQSVSERIKELLKTDPIYKEYKKHNQMYAIRSRGDGSLDWSSKKPYGKTPEVNSGYNSYYVLGSTSEHFNRDGAGETLKPQFKLGDILYIKDANGFIHRKDITEQNIKLDRNTFNALIDSDNRYKQSKVEYSLNGRLVMNVPVMNSSFISVSRFGSIYQDYVYNKNTKNNNSLFDETTQNRLEYYERFALCDKYDSIFKKSLYPYLTFSSPLNDNVFIEYGTSFNNRKFKFLYSDTKSKSGFKMLDTQSNIVLKGNNVYKKSKVDNSYERTFYTEPRIKKALESIDLTDVFAYNKNTEFEFIEFYNGRKFDIAYNIVTPQGVKINAKFNKDLLKQKLSSIVKGISDNDIIIRASYMGDNVYPIGRTIPDVEMNDNSFEDGKLLQKYYPAPIDKIIEFNNIEYNLNSSSKVLHGIKDVDRLSFIYTPFIVSKHKIENPRTILDKDYNNEDVEPQFIDMVRYTWHWHNLEKFVICYHIGVKVNGKVFYTRPHYVNISLKIDTATKTFDLMNTKITYDSLSVGKFNTDKPKNHKPLEGGVQSIDKNVISNFNIIPQEGKEDGYSIFINSLKEISKLSINGVLVMNNYKVLKSSEIDFTNNNTFTPWFDLDRVIVNKKDNNKEFIYEIKFKSISPNSPILYPKNSAYYYSFISQKSSFTSQDVEEVLPRILPISFITSDKQKYSIQLHQEGYSTYKNDITYKLDTKSMNDFESDLENISPNTFTFKQSVQVSGVDVFKYEKDVKKHSDKLNGKNKPCEVYMATLLRLSNLRTDLDYLKLDSTNEDISTPFYYQEDLDKTVDISVNAKKGNAIKTLYGGSNLSKRSISFVDISNGKLPIVFLDDDKEVSDTFRNKLQDSLFLFDVADDRYTPMRVEWVNNFNNRIDLKVLKRRNVTSLGYCVVIQRLSDNMNFDIETTLTFGKNGSSIGKLKPNLSIDRTMFIGLTKSKEIEPLANIPSEYYIPLQTINHLNPNNSNFISNDTAFSLRNAVSKFTMNEYKFDFVNVDVTLSDYETPLENDLRIERGSHSMIGSNDKIGYSISLSAYKPITRLSFLERYQSIKVASKVSRMASIGFTVGINDNVLLDVKDNKDIFTYNGFEYDLAEYNKPFEVLKPFEYDLWNSEELNTMEKWNEQYLKGENVKEGVELTHLFSELNNSSNGFMFITKPKDEEELERHSQIVEKAMQPLKKVYKTFERGHRVFEKANTVKWNEKLKMNDIALTPRVGQYQNMENGDFKKKYENMNRFLILFLNLK